MEKNRVNVRSRVPHRGQSTILYVVMLAMAMTFTVTAMFQYLPQLYSRRAQSARLVGYSTALTSSLSYFKFAVQHRWVLDTSASRDATPLTFLQWATHPRNLERLTLGDLEVVHPTYGLNRRFAPARAMDDLSIMLGLPETPFSLTVSKSAIASTHPLYSVMKLLSQNGEFSKLTFTAKRKRNVNYPHGGRGGVFVWLRVEADGGILSNNAYAETEIGFFPRQITSYAAVFPKDLFLNLPGNAVDFGNTSIPKLPGSSSAKGLVFTSPIFVNGNLTLPSAIDPPPSQDPNRVANPTTFGDVVYLGGEILKETADGVVPAEPSTSGGNGALYSSLEQNRFHGFKQGVIHDGTDKALSYLFDLIDLSDGSDLSDVQTCIDRAKVLSTLSSTTGTTIYAIDRNATSRDIASTGKDYVYELGLDKGNFFVPQGLNNTASKALTVNLDATANAKLVSLQPSAQYEPSRYAACENCGNPPVMKMEVHFPRDWEQADLSIHSRTRAAVFTIAPGDPFATPAIAGDRFHLRVETGNPEDIKRELDRKKSEVAGLQTRLEDQQKVVDDIKAQMDPGQFNALTQAAEAAVDVCFVSQIPTPTATPESSEPDESGGGQSGSGGSAGGPKPPNWRNWNWSCPAQLGSGSCNDELYAYRNLKCQIARYQSAISELPSLPTSIKALDDEIALLQEEYEDAVDGFDFYVELKNFVIDGTSYSQPNRLNLRLTTKNERGLARQRMRPVLFMTPFEVGTDGQGTSVRQVTSDEATSSQPLVPTKLAFGRSGTRVIEAPATSSSPNLVTAYPANRGAPSGDYVRAVEKCAEESGVPAWGGDLTGQAKVVWNFRPPKDSAGNNLNIVFNSSNATPTTPPTKWTVYTALNSSCIVESTATLVTGFYICRRLIIQPRTSALRIIGTFVVGQLQIDPSAMTAGIVWSSVYYPDATTELRRARQLGREAVDPEDATKYGATYTCDSLSNPTTVLDNPIWHPGLSLTFYATALSCQVSALGDKFPSPFTWTSFRPVCGAVGSHFSCLYREERLTSFVVNARSSL